MSQQDTIRRILDAMHVRPETASLYAPQLHAAAVKWGVSAAALPMFLAQTAHESMLFERMVESLNYTKAAQIRRTWPKRFANISAAAACAGSSSNSGESNNGRPIASSAAA